MLHFLAIEACSIATIWPFMFASSAAVCLSPPTKKAAGQNTTIAAAVASWSLDADCPAHPKGWRLFEKFLELPAPIAGRYTTDTSPATHMSARFRLTTRRTPPARRLARRFPIYALNELPRPAGIQAQPWREIKLTKVYRSARNLAPLQQGHRYRCRRRVPSWQRRSRRCWRVRLWSAGADRWGELARNVGLTLKAHCDRDLLVVTRIE